LWRQYRACRRNKRNTRNQLAFEIDVEANLFRLQAELRAHTYRPGRSICFITDGPKPREVFAADFRDRVVHHLLVAQQEPVFERRFIHDSFACRRGKGTLAASDRLMTFLRQATANGRRPAWALKLDVASFFPSIDKATLYDVLEARIRDPEVLWLTRTVLFHDPTEDYAFRARDRRASPPGTPGYPIPLRKSFPPVTSAATCGRARLRVSTSLTSIQTGHCSAPPRRAREIREAFADRRGEGVEIGHHLAIGVEAEAECAAVAEERDAEALVLEERRLRKAGEQACPEKIERHLRTRHVGDDQIVGVQVRQ
jgi:hypothetical protein